MTKSAILHVCLSKGWGGLEMYPIRTGKEFIKRGHHVYGLCTSGSQVAKGMQDAGIEIFEVESKGQLISSQLIKLNKWLKKKDVKIVHCHKSGDILVSALLSLLTKRKTFFTEHMGVTRPKKDLYHKWAYSHLEKVFSISNETYRRNINALPIPKHKIDRLWLGTDIPLTPIEDSEAIRLIKEEMGIDNKSTIVGNVGRVCPGKGQMELLEAFALIYQKHPRLKLLFVGGLDVSNGSDNDFVGKLKDRIAELALESRVHLIGFRKDTERMLAIMDIVCLPNHNEAFGLTAIEAMASKKAIIGANTGALPEILQPVAILANPHKPIEIANSIEIYLNDTSLKENNANAAYDRAKAEFSMENHIKKLRNYYQNQDCNKDMPINLITRLRNKFRVQGKSHTIKLSPSAKIRRCSILIKGQNNTLIIEDNVNIRDCQIEIDGDNCMINIKKHTIIGHNSYLSARENGTKLSIGEDCMLSRNVKIMTSDGHDILKNSTRINPSKDINIGNHVWLADNVTVLKGTSIGDSSILGINSTLTKSIPNNSIAVGNPAKVIIGEVNWRHKLTF